MIPQMVYGSTHLVQHPNDSGIATTQFEFKPNHACSQRNYQNAPYDANPVTFYNTFNHAFARGFGQIRPGDYTDPAEHVLRRKTPNGTLAAGYDGTPVQWSTNAPAQKHVVLPLSATSYQNFNPLILAEQSNWHNYQGIGHHHKIGDDSTHLKRLGEPWNFPLITNSIGTTWNNVNMPSFVGHHPKNINRVTSINQPPAHLPAGITVSNEVGMRFSYLPDVNSLLSLPVGAQPYPFHLVQDIPKTSFQSTYPHLPSRCQQPIEQWFTPIHAQNFRETRSLCQKHVVSKSNENLPSFPNTSANIPRLASNFDESRVLPAQISSRADNAMFKEKILGLAHRIYAELLMFLDQSKKGSCELKNSQSSLLAAKCSIFPKLPRQQGQNTESFKYQKHALSTEDLSRSQSKAVVMAPQEPSFYNQNSISCERFLKGNLHYPEIHSPAPLNQKTPHYASMTHQSLPNTKNILLSKAKEAVEILASICNQNGWDWIDGILVGGCLAYGIAEYHQAYEWYSKVISLDPNHVEAISNLAATLLCLNRQKEAEKWWIHAIKLRPSYLESLEHLVGLLYADNRPQEAVDIIDFVEKTLRLPRLEDHQDQPREISSKSDFEHVELLRTSTELIAIDLNVGNKAVKSTSRLENERKWRSLPGFSSSGFCIPGSENGQMLSLIHAKGNMLYTMGNIEKAAKAFEDAVLISAGEGFTKIQELICKIVEALSLEGINPLRSDFKSRPQNVSGPLLLPPERALQTAKLLFSQNGDLPGLFYVPTGLAKRTAVATTSNSLLSLAKIYQDTTFNCGSKKRLPSISVDVGDILALYYLSLSLQPSPSTANNVGILLAGVQQPPVRRFPSFRNASSIHHNFPGVAPGSSIALALSYYNYGLELDPKHAHIYTNLGSLLKDIGQLTAAITMYERAVACDGSFDIALANLANAVKDQGNTEEAIKFYRRAVAASPDFAEAVCGLANALNSVCDWAGRGGVILNDGKFDRWHVDKMGMIIDGKSHGYGSGWMKHVVDIVQKQLRDGSTWGMGSLQNQVMYQFLDDLEATDCAGSWAPERRDKIKSILVSWSGALWEGSRIIRLVERATKRAMHRWYIDRYVKNQRLPLSHYPRPQILSSLTVPSAPTVLPFHTFTFPLTAKDVRMISQRNALRISCSTLKTPWMQGNVFPPPAPPAPHLNVGYVSSDFNNHPLSHLMQSVFGMHNLSRIKAFCYATTASDNSTHRKKIEREAPVFYDAHTWSVDRLVKQISEDNIHILVNLNGYTRGARNEVFAARPAPIQMSFMGFAGTLGAEWCDYILADETAVPPETLRPWRRNVVLEDQFLEKDSQEDGEWVYSENIIFCRDTFFCCDHAQSEPRDKNCSWDDEQSKRWKMRKELFPSLPDDAIILGNFNQLYKIEPTTFRSWLRILDKVPKAILWLLRFPELGESNLKKTALDWAGESIASRIWFTNVAPKHQHISRARICDLFLDTPECNAHTTAADVLWSSTPLLTLSRYKYKMCSRIAASILKGALPKGEDGRKAAQDLIAEDDEHYEKLAIKLASELTYKKGKFDHPEVTGRLNELRKILYENRLTCALFNTPMWVSDLESAYEEAWRRWVQDEGGDIYL